jgi:hypothetical protein
MKAPDPIEPRSEITRRQWLLRLGEMAALAGISGWVPEAATFAFGSEEQYASLPPGLYEPSAENLVHVLGKGHQVSPPAGSETEYVQADAFAAGPQFFSQDEFRIITRVVEILLGKVSSEALLQSSWWVDLWFRSAEHVRQAARNLDPLHRALAVAYFGEEPVLELETANPAAIARDGLIALHAVCIEKYKAGFSEIGAPEQEQVVRAISIAPASSDSRKFFELLRNEAIRGYYTSSDGLKDLDYKGNAYYPQCPGCEGLGK